MPKQRGQVLHLHIQPNSTFERDCANTARVFPDIIGANAPNAGVKARSPSILKLERIQVFLKPCARVYYKHQIKNQPKLVFYLVLCTLNSLT
jgi:hypothetical protein